jgi:hypothetical protein
MALFPEKEPKIPVSEIPEAPEIPAEIEKGGVRAVPVSPTVSLPQTAAVPSITAQPTPQAVNVPADKTILTSWSKGKASFSLTWLGMFWLRIIKKAIRLGRQVIVGGD